MSIRSAQMKRRSPTEFRFTSLWLLVVCFGLFAASGQAADLSSASYTSRGGHMNAGSASNLTSAVPDPAYSGAAGSLGQSEAIGLSGSATNLATGPTLNCNTVSILQSCQNNL